MAVDIGFKDDVPDDFQTADGFAKIIDKHANHPSVIKIKENIQTQQYFYFTAVNDKYIHPSPKVMADFFSDTKIDMMSLSNLYDFWWVHIMHASVHFLCKIYRIFALTHFAPGF